MRTSPFSSLLLLLLLTTFFSCTIVQRRYMPGFHVEWKKNHRITNQTESTNIRKADIPDTSQVKDQLYEESEVIIPKTVNQNPISENCKPITVNSEPKTANSGLRNPDSGLPTVSVPMDSYSVVTIILAFIVCFFIPPMALLIAFGPGKDFTIDAWLFLGGVFLLLGLFIYLITTPVSAILPLGYTVVMVLAIGFFAAAFFYAMYKLIKALLVKPTE